jgi:hypothetical protein
MLHHTNTSATVVLYQKIPIPTHISSYQKNTRKAKTKVPISVLISQRIKKTSNICSKHQYLFLLVKESKNQRKKEKNQYQNMLLSNKI